MGYPRLRKRRRARLTKQKGAGQTDRLFFYLAVKKISIVAQSSCKPAAHQLHLPTEGRMVIRSMILYLKIKVDWNKCGRHSRAVVSTRGLTTRRLWVGFLRPGLCLRALPCLITTTLLAKRCPLLSGDQWVSNSSRPRYRWRETKHMTSNRREHKI